MLFLRTTHDETGLPLALSAAANEAITDPVAGRVLRMLDPLVWLSLDALLADLRLAARLRAETASYLTVRQTLAGLAELLQHDLVAADTTRDDLAPVVARFFPTRPSPGAALENAAPAMTLHRSARLATGDRPGRGLSLSQLWQCCDGASLFRTNRQYPNPAAFLRAVEELIAAEGLMIAEAQSATAAADPTPAEQPPAGPKTARQTAGSML